MRENLKLSRRRFVATTTALATAGIVPRHVLGGPGQTPPSERLNVAVIGTGGQGIVNIRNLLKHPDVNITAICDVAEFWDNSQIYYRHNGGRGPTMQVIEGHHRDWIDACKGGAAASSNFEYGARLTEIALLGVVALRTGTTLHWDGPGMKATNAPQAEPFIHGHFRKGWEI